MSICQNLNKGAIFKDIDNRRKIKVLFQKQQKKYIKLLKNVNLRLQNDQT